MPTGGQIGSGVKVAYAVTSPHTWVAIPQILEVSIPNVERDRVETTIHGVTSLRTYIPGLGDVSDAELELEANLDVGGVHVTLKDFEQSQTTLWFRFEVPRTATLSTTDYAAVQIQGRIASWVLNTPIDALKTISMSIQFESNYMWQQPMTSQF